MISFIYGIIVFFASAIGSFLGGGSGVIIKPLLTVIVDDSTAIINFVSSVAVFAMSVSSLIKYIRQKSKVDFKKVILISIGSIAGGYIGKNLFDIFLNTFDDNTAMAIQAVILAVILSIALIYVNFCKTKWQFKNPIMLILIGLTMGIISSFLGIGGGPINIMILILFMSMTMKDAAVYSVAIIFFSQLSKLSTQLITKSVPDFDYKILIVVVPCAIIGGIIGAVLNKKANEKIIKNVYSIVLLAFVMLNIYNAVTGFIA